MKQKDRRYTVHGEMKHTAMRGSYVALVTPMGPDGRVNLDYLRRLCLWHIEQGTDGIVTLGTTGEASTLSQAEQDQVAQCVVDTIAGRIPVLVGGGANATSVAVDKCKRFAAMGADGLLVVTPYYNKANEDGMRRHFESIADAVDIPITLYNVPLRTGCWLSVDVVSRLRSHPNIRAIKEASGDIAYVAKIAQLCDDTFSLLSGNDNMIVPVLSLGGVGVISTFANLCPDVVKALTSAWLAGDTARARALQLQYLDLMDALFVEVNPIPVKAAMALRGLDAGPCRLPLGDPSARTLDALRKAMEVLA